MGGVQTHRQCPRCLEVRGVKSFGDGYSICGPCRRKEARLVESNKPGRELERRQSQRDNLRSVTLRKYGMTDADYKALLDVQDGRCAICGYDPGPYTNLHVDHDHATGAVRGLLCTFCNTGLGQFADDTERMRRAIDYLTEPPALSDSSYRNRSSA